MLYAPFDQHNEEQTLTLQTTTDSRADSILTVEQTDSLFLVGLMRGSWEFDHPVYMFFVYFTKAGDLLQGGLGDYSVLSPRS